MMRRTLSAPGKLFLSGEYAVLWGGVARLFAVGPRAYARIRRLDDRQVQVIQEAGVLSGLTTPFGVSWSQKVPATHRFVAYAADFSLRALGREALGFELALSPSQMLPGGIKPGIGSSARAAILSAEACRFILEGPFDALKVALLAHFEAQDQKGSGADVATCFAGGLLRYRRFDTHALAQAAREGRLTSALMQSKPVDLWRMPKTTFPMTYISLGKSAHTPSLVTEVEATFTERDRQDFVERSDAWGMTLEEGLMRADFLKVQEATRELTQLLSTLGPVVTPAAQEALRLAEKLGSVGKTSGAGGGDGCVVFSPDTESQKHLLQGLSENGIWAQALHIEEGLRVEVENDALLPFPTSSTYRP